MTTATTTQLRNFKNCCECAPDGCYEDAKQLNRIIGDTMDELMARLRDAGYSADNCDHAWNLEAAVYDYVKKSNIGMPMLVVSEGYGEAMNGPARARVISQAKENLAAYNRVKA